MLGTSPKSVAPELDTEPSNGCQGAVSGPLPSGRRALHRCVEIQRWSTGFGGISGTEVEVSWPSCVSLGCRDSIENADMQPPTSFDAFSLSPSLSLYVYTRPDSYIYIYI